MFHRKDSGFSISRMSSFKTIENKHDVYRGKDSMKLFCESLKEPTMKMTNFKKKKNEDFNKRAAGNIRKCNKFVIFVKKNFENKHAEDKKYRKVRDHCHYTGIYRDDAHDIDSDSVPKKFLQIFIMNLTMIIILS